MGVGSKQAFHIELKNFLPSLDLLIFSGKALGGAW